MTDSLSFFDKLNITAQRFLSNAVIFLLLILSLRVYEAIVLLFTYNFSTVNFQIEIIALFYDLFYFFKTCAMLIIPFTIIYFIKPKLAHIFLWIVIGFLTITNLLLISYFGTAMVPLGSDLFAYSIIEIQHTIGASVTITVGKVLPFIVSIVVVVVLSVVLQKQKYPSWLFYVFYVLTAFSIVSKDFSVPNPQIFKNDFDSYLAANKLGFFTSKTVDFMISLSEKHNKIQEFAFRERLNEGTKRDNTFEYNDPNYPLMHKVESPDVLGNFFTKNQTKDPNFVFIIVESLGRAYCGENADLSSFTPHLDALMNKSLYWENFLSTGGRTFAVLPSILGSLPFGEKGFADMGESMPLHLSLVKLLKDKGYQSSFIYGGDAHFDNMDVFLRRQGIDEIVDAHNFGKGYSKLPANDEGFSWGYGDRDIFNKLQELSQNRTKPRIDIVLTLAMHDPFRINDQTFYDNKFERRLKELQLPENIKEERRTYKKQFATMLYFDDAIDNLIQEYSKRDDFNNTIFIITGDHRMPEIPISSQIDRFHVPLIIYSPMLKSSAKFSSISTQFDITPSILAFLSQNYGMEFPTSAPWMGSGLDTVRNFRNIHSYPLMRNKNELLDYIDGNYFLSNDLLYSITPNLDIVPDVDDTKRNEMRKKFNDFKSVNSFVCSTNHLLPESVYNLLYSRKANIDTAKQIKSPLEKELE